MRNWKLDLGNDSNRIPSIDQIVIAKFKLLASHPQLPKHSLRFFAKTKNPFWHSEEIQRFRILAFMTNLSLSDGKPLE
jgi:hypothetical protein